MRRVRADVTRKVHAVFCDFARPSKARKTVAKAAVSMPRRGGNEVWDDLGFDPTEAERRKGNRAETVLQIRTGERKNIEVERQHNDRHHHTTPRRRAARHGDPAGHDGPF